jgi:hypothetical protein
MNFYARQRTREAHRVGSLGGVANQQTSLSHSDSLNCDSDIGHI